MTPSLDSVLAGILSKKTNEGKDNLQIKDLGFIHPIHEAVAATFKQNFSDSEISARFAMDENSLRAVIATETLMDNLDSHKKQELKQLFTSGAPLAEIAGKAAIQLAENKRIQDGKVLQNVAKTSNQPMKYVVEALKSESPEILYVDGNKMLEIDKRAVKIKRDKKSKAILGVLLGALLVVGTYHLAVNKKDFIKEMATRKTTTEKLIAGLEAKVSDAERYVTRLDSEKIKVKSYEKEATLQQEKITQLTDRANLIQSDIVKKGESLSQLEKTLALNNKELSSTKSKLENIQTLISDEEKKTLKLANDYFNIGCGYYAIAKEEEAIEAYKRALELAPNNIDPLTAMAAVHIKKRSYSIASEYLKKAQKIEPDNALLNSHLAACYTLMGDNSKAIETYNLVLDKEPNNKLANYTLGNLYSTSRNKSDAIRCFKKYLKLEDTFEGSKIAEVKEKVAKLESER